jgi:hypothetical protein
LVDALAEAGKMPSRARVRNTFEISEDDSELGATQQEADIARDRHAALAQAGGSSNAARLPSAVVGMGDFLGEEDDDEDDEDEEDEFGALHSSSNVGFGEMLGAATAAAAAGNANTSASMDWKRPRADEQHADVGDAVSGMLSGDVEEATL